jgi:hypothetical protein
MFRHVIHNILRLFTGFCAFPFLRRVPRDRVVDEMLSLPMHPIALSARRKIQINRKLVT